MTRCYVVLVTVSLESSVKEKRRQYNYREELDGCKENRQWCAEVNPNPTPTVHLIRISHTVSRTEKSKCVLLLPAAQHQRGEEDIWSEYTSRAAGARDPRHHHFTRPNTKKRTTIHPYPPKKSSLVQHEHVVAGKGKHGVLAADQIQNNAHYLPL
jgi:hypothetical protein